MASPGTTAGTPRKLMLASVGRGPGRRLADHLGQTLRIAYGETAAPDPDIDWLGEFVRTPAQITAWHDNATDDARGIMILQNPMHFVSAALRRGGDVEAAVSQWNGLIDAAVTLAGAGRFRVFGFDDLFVQQRGWDAISALLGTPIAPPAEPTERPAISLDADVVEHIARHASIDSYQRLLDRRSLRRQRRRQQAKPAVRMYEGDDDVIDYDFQDIGARIALRRTLDRDIPATPDIAFIGSAAVFGRLVHEPFPTLVAKETGRSVANLGFGGARPEAYLSDPKLMEIVEGAEVTVIELMSGRGYENDMFAPVDPIFNAVQIKPAYWDRLEFSDPTEHLFIDHVWNRAFKVLSADELSHLIAQSSARLENDLKELVRRSRRPVVVHLAQKPLPDVTTEATYRFPHFVTQGIADRVTAGLPWCSIVSQTGVPSAIVSRFTGEPVARMTGWPDPTVNAYYPSPEMHREAAAALVDLLGRI